MDNTLLEIEVRNLCEDMKSIFELQKLMIAEMKAQNDFNKRVTDLLKEIIKQV